MQQLAIGAGIAAACAGLGVSRATYYRQQRPRCEPKPKSKPARSLSEVERQEVLEVLHSERFVDQSPAEVYATLLDEGRFLCSVRTFYRILAEHQEVRERCHQLRHPNYQKPERLATSANQLWSWDISLAKVVSLKCFNPFAAGQQSHLPDLLILTPIELLQWFSY